MKPLNIEGLEQYYSISNDGVIYSNISKRILKGALNSAGYLMQHLAAPGTKGRSYMIHNLVARTYISNPPSDKYEVNHKDHNKLNNHIDNLEWVTHSQNLLLSYSIGGHKRCTGKRGKLSDNTKLKMSIRKFKPVKVTDTITGDIYNFNSVADSLFLFSNCRRYFNLILTGKKSSSFIIEF